MEKHSRGGDFFRPPPTSPKGHPRKKLRREGPPRQREDNDWSRPPPSLSPPVAGFQDDDDGARESKPHHLGGYLIESDLRIRGKSHALPKSEEGYDSEPESNSLGNLERTFVSTARSIFALVQNIESVTTKSGYAPTHPISRAVARIQGQLDRLNDVYHAMGAEMESMGGELDQLAAREESLRKDLDNCKTTNFKLACSKKDLGEEVHSLKSAAAGTEVELRRLKRDLEDREAEQTRLEASLRELQEERRKTGAEKLWLEDTVRKRDVSIETAAADNRRMQNLVQEMEQEMEGLKSNNLGLQSLIQQREGEAEAAKAESLRLQDLIRSKEAHIASLAVVPPITPLSPLGPSGPFSSLAGPVLPMVPQGHTLPPRSNSPLPYIKQEAPDPTPPAAFTVPATTPAEQLEVPTQRVSHIGVGAADILSRLFAVDRPISCDNPVLSSFLSNLGAAPEASSIPITRSTTEFWTLNDPWTTQPPPQRTLRGTLEEQFTHLCLLFPFPGTTPTINPADHPNNGTIPNPATFHLLTTLLTALTRADYSTAPRAAWAFLQTMSGFLPPFLLPSPTSSTSATATATRTALLSVMLAELCRALAAALQMPPSAVSAPLLWQQQQQQQQQQQGGDEGQARPLARLAGLLRDVDRSGADGGLGGLADGLVAAAGDGFCVFSYGCGTPGSSGGKGGEVEVVGREVGLLHCGGGDGGSGFFLMIDFAERSLRAVDCRLAGMRPNAAEPRKLDLIVARPDDGRDDGEEEELFRLAAAPRDVAAFWVKYAMGDD
ncbi:uncharacterized protein B0H64DRAFT_436738 [Chaetomium fimeti]|uniref:Uncharacterized protein n=1 Tax=Chaetomium fimeti TaxID=1854472 RepID=A0AAE0LME1_9PEZI|nr:hypothetical protein B0H64DRAFT_436738 [Chaetomium fimeti]